jgi:type IV pilus assembly protein PilA
MLHALRQRLAGVRDEEGFTLIELMVVVLIIAILIAIAIPTFLGARQRAQDRAAQSNLRNALTAEKTYYTDNQKYTNDVAAGGALVTIEPSLTYAADAIPAATGTVYVAKATTTTTDDTTVLGIKSASGTCFYIKDVTGTGTTYGKDSSCAKAPSAATVASTSW